MAVAGAWGALRRKTPRAVRRAAWRTLTALRRTEPGLLMRYGSANVPEPLDPPPGYELRSWQPGDDEEWIELLNASGSFGQWDHERLATEAEGLVRTAQFFIVHRQHLVAATGILERQLDRLPGLELAWVVRHPSFKERRLGRCTVIRALRSALEWSPPRPIFLYTDDERLTAIEIYLELGFIPDLESHKSYPRRWQAVNAALALRKTAALSEETPAAGGHEVPASPAGQ